MAVQRINHIQVNEAYEDFMVDTHRYNVLFGSAGCFDSETLVNTSTGPKRLCDVEIGDMVLSFNETLLTPEYKQVVNKFCYEVRTIGQKMITFAFDNQLIKCTHGHKFYYKGTWVEASELAIRILERSGFGKRNILHQRFRSFINDKPLWFGEDGNNEACTGWKWIFSYCNSKKRQTEEIVYNKGSQTCCGSVCSESNQSAGSESQGWSKGEQCCGELGMGNSQAKHSTLVCKQTTNQYRVEEPNKQTNGKGCCRNKACATSVNNSKENRFSSEVWSSNRHYKAYCVQTGQMLDSCEIDIDNVKTITFSDESQLVYDLQVKDNSNYCVGNENVIVHNSGKSAAAAQKIILRCITEVGTMEEPFRHIITVVRKYKTTLRGTVFEQIKGECMRMGIDEMMTINESYGVFKFWNGAEIRLIGLDDPEKIKSLVSTGCWIEEATELEEADFSQLDLRFRGEAPYCKQLILSFNPVNQSHWIKRRFFDTPQNGFTYVLHTTYKDNYFIDQQYKKLLEEQYKFDENLYRIYVLGEWGRIKTGSDFFFNFRHDKHVHKVNYEKGLPLHISFDWNVSPYISAVV